MPWVENNAICLWNCDLSMMIWDDFYMVQTGICTNPADILVFYDCWSLPLCFCCLRPGKKASIYPAPDLPFFLVLAFFEPFYTLWREFRMQRISPTLGSVIVATIPLFTPLAASLFYHERFTRINVAASSFPYWAFAWSCRRNSLSVQPSREHYWCSWRICCGGYSVMVIKLAGHTIHFPLSPGKALSECCTFYPCLYVWMDHVWRIQWTFAVILPLLELALFGSPCLCIFYLFD